MKCTLHHDGILPYALYQPDVIPSQTTLPLIVFLHGIGERGTDPQVVRKYGLPKFLDLGLEIPFIMYAPQCPDTVTWGEITDQILAGTADIISRLPVDTARTYLTGFSMGGRGLWTLAVQHPQAFVAYAPVAARIPYAGFLEQVTVLRDQPLWVFHGAKDEAVGVENSDEIVATLQAAGATNLHYTRYDDAGHGEASDWAYQDTALYQWFLAQS